MRVSTVLLLVIKTLLLTRPVPVRRTAEGLSCQRRSGFTVEFKYFKICGLSL